MADNTHQDRPQFQATAEFSAAVDAIIADFFAGAKKAHPPIDAQERYERQKAVDSARASVELEGFKLDGVVQELARRYVAGELDMDEWGDVLRAYSLRKEGHHA